MSKKNNHIVVIDFETGGLDCRKDAVTEVGAIILRQDNFDIVEKYQSYILPYHRVDLVKRLRKKGESDVGELMNYEAKALEYTQITMDKLYKKGKPLKDVVDALCGLFERANIDGGRTTKPFILGQNVKFDIGFLQQIFAFCKKDLSKYFEGGLDFYGNFQPDRIDTLIEGKIYYALDDNVTSHKLELMCEREGIELVAAHEALDDVYATRELFKTFVNKMRSGVVGSGNIKDKRTRDHFKF